jgi:hypothetical protein
MLVRVAFDRTHGTTPRSSSISSAPNPGQLSTTTSARSKPERCLICWPTISGSSTRTAMPGRSRSRPSGGRTTCRPSAHPTPTQKGQPGPRDSDNCHSGGGIRTRDLRVMSPTSYQTAPPRGGLISLAKDLRSRCHQAGPPWRTSTRAQPTRGARSPPRTRSPRALTAPRPCSRVRPTASAPLRAGPQARSGTPGSLPGLPPAHRAPRAPVAPRATDAPRTGRSAATVLSCFLSL